MTEAPEHLDKDWRIALRTELEIYRPFAKEFRRGFCQQRAREKTKENAGTLPLALRMMYGLSMVDFVPRDR